MVLERQQGGNGGESDPATSTAPLPWAAAARFTSLSHWNHDAAPSKNDPLRRCLDWAALAGAMHAPVSVADVEAQLGGGGGGSSGRGSCGSGDAAQGAS